jgi:hypothetical protein
LHMFDLPSTIPIISAYWPHTHRVPSRSRRALRRLPVGVRQVQLNNGLHSESAQTPDARGRTQIDIGNASMAQQIVLRIKVVIVRSIITEHREGHQGIRRRLPQHTQRDFIAHGVNYHDQSNQRTRFASAARHRP